MSKFYGKHLHFKACQNLTLEADICQKKRPKHVSKTTQTRSKNNAKTNGL